MKKIESGIIMSDGKRFMQDSQGRFVPEDMIKEIDRTRDQIVRESVSKALTMAEEMAVYRARLMADVKAFIDLSMEKYGVKVGGMKGNVTLTSFDGAYRITIAVNDLITFDERLKAAKALIDECIKEWTNGSRSEIKILIDDAFAVDKEGKINTKRVLGLRRMDITDSKWRKAMDAISDSVQITGSREYIRIHIRNDKTGEYEMLNLDPNVA